MSKSKRRRPNEGCEMDMTPMIDVTFQLIIFFVVTIKFTENANPDIVLEDGKHGEIITADELARHAETIPYEIMLGFTPRVRRVWED